MALRSDMVTEDFDPHFKVFHDLMLFKVQEVLLVSSLYAALLIPELRQRSSGERQP